MKVVKEKTKKPKTMTSLFIIFKKTEGLMSIRVFFLLSAS